MEVEERPDGGGDSCPKFKVSINERFGSGVPGSVPARQFTDSLEFAGDKWGLSDLKNKELHSNILQMKSPFIDERLTSRQFLIQSVINVLVETDSVSS
jgi:hypothetical protein